MPQPRADTPLTPAVMVHLYRGLQDRAGMWRARIDNTTNWAIVSAGSIASFVLSAQAPPHLMALLGMVLTFAFLWIEARRFRFYDVWASWIRVLETDYFVPVLRDNTVLVEAPWQGLLMRDLVQPHFKISWAEALGRRLRYSYWALFGFLLLTWVLTLVQAAAGARSPCATVVQCAAIGPIPGRAVLLLVLLFYSVLISLILRTPTRKAGGTDLLSQQQCLRRLAAPSGSPMHFPRRAAPVRRGRGVLQPPEED